MTYLVRPKDSGQSVHLQITTSMLNALDIARELTPDECTLWARPQPGLEYKLGASVEFSVHAPRRRLVSIAKTCLAREGLTSVMKSIWESVLSCLPVVYNPAVLFEPPITPEYGDEFFIIDWDDAYAGPYHVRDRVMSGRETHPIMVSGYLDYYTFTFLRSLGLGNFQHVRPSSARTVLIHPFFTRHTTAISECFDSVLQGIAECSGSPDDLAEFESMYSPYMTVPVCGTIMYNDLYRLHAVIGQATEDSDLPDCRHLDRLVRRWLESLKSNHE